MISLVAKKDQRTKCTDHVFDCHPHVHFLGVGAGCGGFHHGGVIEKVGGMGLFDTPCGSDLTTCASRYRALRTHRVGEAFD